MELEFRESYVEFDEIQYNAYYSKIFLEERMQFLEVHFINEDFSNKEKQRKTGVHWSNTGTFFGKDVEGNIVKGYALQTIECDFLRKKAKFRILYKTEKFNTNHNEKAKASLLGNETLYAVEIEDLEIQHTDFYEHRENRRSWNIKDLDYTSARLKSTRLDNIFQESPLHFRRLENGVTSINFYDDKKREFPLKYEGYKRIREHFLSLLEFLNGGKIYIIKEYFGDWHIKSKSAEIEVTYSHFPKRKFPLNEFIPLSSNQRISNEILRESFFNSFDKFIDADEKYDLKKLISSLTSSNTLIDKSEKFKILIIAYEAISYRVMKQESPEFKHERIPDKLFQKIKEEIFKILDENTKLIPKEFEDGYKNIKSRIGGINRVREKNREKIKFLLDFCNIEITDDLNYFIEEIRNSSVHEDFIHFDFKEEDRFCNLLNDILRFVILNLMNYKSYYRPSPYCKIVNVSKKKDNTDRNEDSPPNTLPNQ